VVVGACLAAANALAFGFTAMVVFFFFAADGFLAGAFVTAFFAGIGIVMPGIFLCADAGVAASANESALAAVTTRLSGMP
jgi:hypothetical protein